MNYVFATPEFPGYSYTIGFFETLKLPEIIIFGINSRKCYSTFCRAFALLQRSKENFPYSEKNYEILQDNVPVIFNEVKYSVAYEYFDYCNEYYQDKTFIYPAMQLVWPDEKHFFPWEEDYNNRYKRQQPIICSR